MTISRPFYTFPLQLLNCRVVSTTNIAGTYFNGTNNSGVGAILTVTAMAALTIDSVALNVNDYVLLNGQTSNFQNGIYTVINPGSTSSQPVLQRRVDFQSIEQMKPGQYLSISAGTVNAGSMFVLIEPLPTSIGVSPITFDSVIQSAGLGTAATKNASNNADPTLASVTGAYVVGDLPTFADVNGSLADSGITPGTASGKAASNPADPTVASVTGAYVIGNIATYADVNGSLADSGIAPSNPALPTVSSVSGATVAGNLLQAADTAGTVQDVGVSFHGIQAVGIAGGATSFSIPIAAMTGAAVAVAVPNHVTNPAYLVDCTTGIGTLDLTFNTDPGASTINIFWTSNSF